MSVISNVSRSVVAAPKPEVSAKQPERVEVTQATSSSSQAASGYSEAPAVTVELSGGAQATLPGGVVLSLEMLEALQLPKFFNDALAATLPSLAGQPMPEKGAQLLRFLVPFGERLATLDAHGELPGPTRSELTEHVVKAMANVGLGQVIDVPPQRSGLQVAQAVLTVREPQDAQRTLDGVKLEATPLMQGAVTPAFVGRTHTSTHTSEEPEAQRGRKRWMALHTVRALFDRREREEQWWPEEKAWRTAGLVALSVVMGVAALLTLLR